jgi:hypothetical protein
MRALIDILSTYEGAIQEDNDSHDDESAKNLETARNELMVILRQAKELEKYKDALKWAMPRLNGEGLRKEGYGNYPPMYDEVRKLAYDE